MIYKILPFLYEKKILRNASLFWGIKDQKLKQYYLCSEDIPSRQTLVNGMSRWRPRLTSPERPLYILFDHPGDDHIWDPEDVPIYRTGDVSIWCPRDVLNQPIWNISRCLSEDALTLI